MSRSGRNGGRAVEGSNVPGNPLRSYRMSMLAHGFVDRDTDNEFTLDEHDSITYAVVRRHKTPVTMASVAALGILLILIAAIVLLT